MFMFMLQMMLMLMMMLLLLSLLTVVGDDFGMNIKRCSRVITRNISGLK